MNIYLICLKLNWNERRKMGNWMIWRVSFRFFESDKFVFFFDAVSCEIAAGAFSCGWLSRKKDMKIEVKFVEESGFGVFE